MSFSTKNAACFLLSFILIPTASFANPCGRLHVVITNSTQNECGLASWDVKHGELLSSLPASLKSRTQASFDIEQAKGFGPEVKFAYTCANKAVDFFSQQNYCFLKAGKISATFEPSSPGISARYSVREGSYGRHRYGELMWFIAN